MFAASSIPSWELAEVEKIRFARGDAAAKEAEQVFYEAQRQQLRDDATRHLVQDATAGLAVVTIMAAAVGALMSGRLLRRVRRVTAAAQSANDTNLGVRLNLPGPRDEIKELGDTFDAMLGRLESGIEAQRRFVANASHELRTPLAVARTATEVVLAKPQATAEQLRAMCEEARTAMIRAQRLVDSLLVLARSDQGVKVREVDDLADMVAESIDHIAEVARSGGITIRAELEQAPVEGDVALLERAVANLVENAVAHNHDGGDVVAATGVHNGRAWAEVTNTGADLSMMDIQRLFEPFHRGSRTRLEAGGSGLGLSIVAAVTRAHGGTVAASARMASEGGGLLVRLELPAVL
jgi:signal transduction histidine kinase